MFYQSHLDCARLMSDFYDNTPRVSAARNHAPRFINLRWGNDLDPSKAVVEFFNYNSIVPYQQATTITSRDSYGLYSRTSPALTVPISATIAAPPGAQYFRIRIDRNGPLVTNNATIHNNGMYYYEQGMIFETYSF